MERIALGQSGSKKISKNVFELYKQDLEHSLKGITPGQWCEFVVPKNKKSYIGYINAHVAERRPCAYILDFYDGNKEPWIFIKQKLEHAILKRVELYKYGSDSRLVYGSADDLSGLIVDSYQNCLYIQINTAGIDIFREKIRGFFQEQYPQKICLFLDNETYRKGEMLPVFEVDDIEPSVIKIKENDIIYEVSKENKQKIGYYYDHRENRKRAGELVSYLKRDNLRGLDLFCYIGSWGLNLLKSGVSNVDFVDQGKFEEEIQRNLSLNDFSENGNFERANVFEYLKQNKEARYDIICSDPPAFCKTKKDKRKAIDGYQKLHKLCFDILKPKSIFLACSCTHYVDHSEFQQTITYASRQTGRKIQLIDIGIQGYDHPIESTDDKESYLKYYAYYVE